MLRRLLLCGVLLLAVGVAVLVWFRPKLDIDERYHDIPLGVTSHKVSPKLVELLSQDQYLDEESQGMSELAFMLTQLKPPPAPEPQPAAEGGASQAQRHDGHDHQNHKGHGHDHGHGHNHGAQKSPVTEEQRVQILQTSRALLKRRQEELKLAEAAFTEPGCSDDLSPRQGRLSVMNLLKALKLLNISLHVDRLSQDPSASADRLTSYLSRADQRQRVCLHSVLTYIAVNQVALSLKRVALSVIAHPRLSAEKRTALLRALTLDIDDASEAAYRLGLQNSARVEHLQLSAMLSESGLTEGVKKMKADVKNSVFEMWPFLDQSETEGWLKEGARAQVWGFGQPADQPIPDDLAVDRFTRLIEESPSMPRYNMAGALLFSIAYTPVGSLRDSYYASRCNWFRLMTKELKKLNIEAPPVVNPFTAKPFDERRRRPCKRKRAYE